MKLAVQAADDHGNEREKLYARAMSHWLQGELPEAVKCFEDVVAKWPTDLMAVKRGQLLAFFQGKSEQMLSIARAAEEACAKRPYFQGMLAFALEQCCQLDEAEQAGLAGSDCQPDDAWAHHAVAHALFFQGRGKEGIKWMQERKQHWADLMPFMRCHNWWHLCLFHLDEGDFQS